MRVFFSPKRGWSAAAFFGVLLLFGARVEAGSEPLTLWHSYRGEEERASAAAAGPGPRSWR